MLVSIKSWKEVYVQAGNKKVFTVIEGTVRGV